MKNKQDKVYGLKLTYGDHSLKASEISREFGFRTLPKQFEFDNTLKPIIPSSYSSTRSTKDSTPIVQGTDSVVDTALDTAESLLSEVGEVTTLQTHGADYAEIAWQRRLRNEAGKKKKRGRGNGENRIKNTCNSNTHSNIVPSNDKRPLFVQIPATPSASLVSTSLPIQCLRPTNFFFCRGIFLNSFLCHQNSITREQNLITHQLNLARMSSKFDHSRGKKARVSSKFDHTSSKFDHVRGKKPHASSKFDHMRGKKPHASSKFDHTRGKKHLVSSKFDHTRDEKHLASSKFDHRRRFEPLT